jgi:hypothetical protein
MIVSQNALINQYVPTFFIKNLVDGQIVMYDSTRKAFVNVDPVVATSSINRLGELLNVDDNVDNPFFLQNGQALVYDSFTSLWTNKFVDFNTLLNQPTSSSYSFIGLSDTAKPSIPGGYVLWDPTGTQLIYSTTIPVSSITGLAPVATGGTFGTLTNVLPAADSLNNTSDVGKTIVWNGTAWAPLAGGSGTGNVKAIWTIVSLSTNGTTNIDVAIPANSIVLSVKVKVTTADSSATLSVGVSGNTQRYMTITENDPQSVGIYVSETYDTDPTSVQIIATVLLSSGIGSGSANVLVEYKAA